MYFERFLGLDDVAVLISGAPIRFTAYDFSRDSAPAAQMSPHGLVQNLDSGLDSWTGLWTDVWTGFWTDTAMGDDHFQP